LYTRCRSSRSKADSQSQSDCDIFEERFHDSLLEKVEMSAAKRYTRIGPAVAETMKD
jgi:hypothetical protein